MIEFKKLALRDKAWVDEILRSEDSESADYNFGNMYMWVKKYPGLLYINREEDMNIDAIRYSKMSYSPLFLLKKYDAEWINRSAI